MEDKGGGSGGGYWKYVIGAGLAVLAVGGVFYLSRNTLQMRKDWRVDPEAEWSLERLTAEVAKVSPDGDPKQNAECLMEIIQQIPVNDKESLSNANFLLSLKLVPDLVDELSDEAEARRFISQATKTLDYLVEIRSPREGFITILIYIVLGKLGPSLTKEEKNLMYKCCVTAVRFILETMITQQPLGGFNISNYLQHLLDSYFYSNSSERDLLPVLREALQLFTLVPQPPISPLFTLNVCVAFEIQRQQEVAWNEEIEKIVEHLDALGESGVESQAAVSEYHRLKLFQLQAHRDQFQVQDCIPHLEALLLIRHPLHDSITGIIEDCFQQLVQERKEDAQGLVQEMMKSIDAHFAAEAHGKHDSNSLNAWASRVTLVAACILILTGADDAIQFLQLHIKQSSSIPDARAARTLVRSLIYYCAAYNKITQLREVVSDVIKDGINAIASVAVLQLYRQDELATELSVSLIKDHWEETGPIEALDILHRFSDVTTAKKFLHNSRNALSKARAQATDLEQREGMKTLELVCELLDIYIALLVFDPDSTRNIPAIERKVESIVKQFDASDVSSTSGEWTDRTPLQVSLVYLVYEKLGLYGPIFLLLSRWGILGEQKTSGGLHFISCHILSYKGDYEKVPTSVLAYNEFLKKIFVAEKIIFEDLDGYGFDKVVVAVHRDFGRAQISEEIEQLAKTLAEKVNMYRKGDILLGVYNLWLLYSELLYCVDKPEQSLLWLSKLHSILAGDESAGKQNRTTLKARMRGARLLNELKRKKEAKNWLEIVQEPIQNFGVAREKIELDALKAAVSGLECELAPEREEELKCILEKHDVQDDRRWRGLCWRDLAEGAGSDEQKKKMYWERAQQAFEGLGDGWNTRMQLSLQ